MNFPSEGVKRVVMVLSYLFAGVFFLYILVISDGFTYMEGVDWIWLIGLMGVAFAIPIVAAKLFYWIKGGFDKDKGE